MNVVGQAGKETVLCKTRQFYVKQGQHPEERCPAIETLSGWFTVM